MTTAHKPTFHPAIGSEHQGGYRYVAPRQQFSARDVAAHTKLKFRQIGQDAPEEIARRDLKAELEERERKVQEEKNKERKRMGLKVEEPETTTLDTKAIDLSKFDDADEESGEDESDDDSDSDSDEDEEAELLRELEKIKQEREAERQRREIEEQQLEEKQRADAVLTGNPLLAENRGSFKIKRRWDDDVVFKHQSKDEPVTKKRFINDTIRSDFHKSFLRRYIK